MFKKAIVKDIIVRKNFKINELNFKVIKYLLCCDDVDNISRDWKYYLTLKHIRKFHLNSSSARVVNKCIITARSHWVLRHFRYSRMTFRKFADKGFLMGVRRSSW